MAEEESAPDGSTVGTSPVLLEPAVEPPPTGPPMLAPDEVMSLPAGSAGTPPRKGVETRVLAAFPDLRPPPPKRQPHSPPLPSLPENAQVVLVQRLPPSPAESPAAGHGLLLARAASTQAPPQSPPPRHQPLDYVVSMTDPATGHTTHVTGSPPGTPPDVRILQEAPTSFGGPTPGRPRGPTLEEELGSGSGPASEPPAAAGESPSEEAPPSDSDTVSFNGAQPGQHPQDPGPLPLGLAAGDTPAGVILRAMMQGSEPPPAIPAAGIAAPQGATPHDRPPPPRIWNEAAGMALAADEYVAHGDGGQRVVLRRSIATIHHDEVPPAGFPPTPPPTPPPTRSREAEPPSSRPSPSRVSLLP